MSGNLRPWTRALGTLLLVLLGLSLLTLREGRPSSIFLVGAILQIVLFSLFALGLVLTFGNGGLLNFGHSAFALLGAYGLGLGHLFGYPWWVGVLLGVVLSLLFALLLGAPSLRLRADSLAIVTIGGSEILRTFLTSEVSLTRGPLGIYGFERPGMELASSPLVVKISGAVGALPYPFLLLGGSLVLWALASSVGERLLSSPWGRALRAVREDEEVARSVGKDTFKIKLQVFLLGALPASLSGIIYSWFVAQIVPNLFPPLFTFYAFLAVAMGGESRMAGALAGSAVLWGILLSVPLLDLSGLPAVGGVLEPLTRPGPGQSLLVGLLLLLVVFARPRGIVEGSR